MNSEQLQDCSKEQLLEHIRHLEQDFALFSKEAKTIEEILDQELEGAKTELEQAQEETKSKSIELQKVTQVLLETKRDLQTARDHLVERSLRTIEGTRSQSMSPRKRTRQPLQPTISNNNLIPELSSKLIHLETENDTLESSARSLKYELETSREKYDICIEKIAHLEQELSEKCGLEQDMKLKYESKCQQKQSELRSAFEEQMASIKLKIQADVLAQKEEELKASLLKDFTVQWEQREHKFHVMETNWEQERKAMKHTQHLLQERLESWKKVMDTTLYTNDELKRKCVKLERIARLVKIKEQGGPFSAFTTPSLT